MKRQNVSLVVTGEAVHDAVGSEDHFAYEGTVELWNQAT
jgi:hypothetical protein